MRNERLNKVDKVRIRGEPREDEVERMRMVTPVVFEGETWYRLRDVCHALRVDPRCVGELVEPEHKHRQYEFHRGYRSIVYTLIDRKGVEEIVTRYCTIARSEIMGALRK